MHAFIGDHLIVFDAFGLTRLTLGGKVKHNKKVAGDFMVANSGLLVGHSLISSKHFALTVPKLEVVPVKDWSYKLQYGTSLAVAPDEHIVDATDGALALHDRTGEQRGRVEPPDGRVLAALELGPRRTARWANRIAIGPDGTYVLFGDGQLFGGVLAGGKIARAWSAPAPLPQGHIHLRAGAWGAFVSAFHPARGEARCVLVGPGGDGVAQATVACIAPVDFDGARVAYQASPRELCRVPIRGGDVERFELPASAHGAGTVMADGDRLLFVAPDRERVVDVADDDILVRGLADADRPARAKLLAFVERFRPAADAANLDLQLGAMCPPAYGAGPRPQWAWDAGDESVLAAMVVGNLLTEAYRAPDTSAGSFSHVQTLAPVSAASVAHALATLDANRLGLLGGLWMVATPLADHYHPRRGGDGKPRFAKDAARMLLHAVIATHGKPEQPLLAPHAAAWASTPLDAAAILAAIDPRVSFSAGVHSDAELAVLWIVVDYLGAGALPVLLDWLIARPSPMVVSNMHIVGAPAAALAKLFPETKEALLATALKSTIEFELR